MIGPITEVPVKEYTEYLKLLQILPGEIRGPANEIANMFGFNAVLIDKTPRYVDWVSSSYALVFIPYLISGLMYEPKENTFEKWYDEISAKLQAIKDVGKVKEDMKTEESKKLDDMGKEYSSLKEETTKVFDHLEYMKGKYIKLDETMTSIIAYLDKKAYLEKEEKRRFETHDPHEYMYV